MTDLQAGPDRIAVPGFGAKGGSRIITATMIGILASTPAWIFASGRAAALPPPVPPPDAITEEPGALADEVGRSCRRWAIASTTTPIRWC